MATETKVYDLYAAILNYKQAISSLSRPAITLSLVPEYHLRRLKAYQVLHAYYETYSRDYRQAPESGDTGNNDDIFEVNTPGWLCEKIKNKLLGGDVKINIPVPKSLGRAEDIEKILADDELEAEMKTGLTEQLANLKQVKARLAQREAYLQDWFSDAMVYLAIDKNESKASYLGDCVYLPYWNEADACPGVQTIDPGFCFPDFNIDAGTDEAKSWEQKGDEAPALVSDRFVILWETIINDDTYIRIKRIVYELRVGLKGERRCFKQESFYDVPAGSTLQLDELTEDMVLDGQDSKWIDTGLDFIPAVWVPNFEVEGDVFGKSNLSGITPLFDSLMNSETDLASNSEHLGGAAVALSGEEAKPKKGTDGLPLQTKVEPNSILYLGAHGRMDLLDTSRMQDALLKTLERYDKKIIQLSDLTEIVAGMVNAQQIPSGVALKVLMQPLMDKITPMRQQRQQHYGLLFYYIQRFYQLYGSAMEKALFSGVLYDVKLQFGNIMPVDRKADIEYYTALLEVWDEQTVLEQMKRDGYEVDIEAVLKRKAAERAAKAAQEQAFMNYQRGQDGGSGEPQLDAEGNPIPATGPETHLNGAQIQAAAKILHDVAAKQIPAASAIELLVAVGIPRDKATKMANESAAHEIEVPNAPAGGQE